MKIAISTNLFPPVISGSSSYSADICKALSELGHDVYLIIPQMDIEIDYSEFGLDRKNVLLLPAWKVPATKIMIGFSQLRSTFKHGNLGRVIKFLKENKVEFVYQQSHVFDTAYYTRIACKRLGISRAICHHTYILHNNRLYNGILKFAEKYIVGSVFMGKDDLWVCPSAMMYDHCSQRFPKVRRVISDFGINPFPSCNAADIIANAQELSRRHNPILLSVGHITGLRSRIDFIKAIGILKNDYPNIGLILIGDEQYPNTRETVVSLGLEKNVVFLGILPREKIRPYIDISVAEGHWYLGDSVYFSISSFEAMACGICCISSADENCNERVKFIEGENYLRVSVDDVDNIVNKVRFIIENPERSKNIGLKGQKLMEENFNWLKIAADLVEKFKEHMSYNSKFA